MVFFKKVSQDQRIAFISFIRCWQCLFWRSTYYIWAVRSAKESPSTKTQHIPDLTQIPDITFLGEFFPAVRSAKQKVSQITSNTYLNSAKTFSKFGYNVFISGVTLSVSSAKFHKICVQSKTLGSRFKYYKTFWIFEKSLFNRCDTKTTYHVPTSSPLGFVPGKVCNKRFAVNATESLSYPRFSYPLFYITAAC